MIVDDSIVARTVLARIFEGRPDFRVVAAVSGADSALATLDHTRVDIILLDVEMPGMDGLTALPELLARSNGARVLIVSSACADGALATIKALSLGAADTLLKPAAGSFGNQFSETLIDRLLRIGRAPSRATDMSERPVEQAGLAAPAAQALFSRVAVARPIECLAIGASTGGIHALNDFFRALPAAFDAPILITQHLPAVFMPYFAAQLRDLTGRAAHVATDGARLRPSEILIAPGDAHMGLIRMSDGVRVRLERTPAVSGCLPSVDPMFAALARTFGAAGIAVVLSGMGRDGQIGATSCAAAGVEVLAQDEESSVVWGMPGAVVAAGVASAVLPPARIARRIEYRMTVQQGHAPWS